MVGIIILANIDISTRGGKNRPVSMWHRISRFGAVGMVSMVVVCLTGIIVTSDCMIHSNHLYLYGFGSLVFCCGITIFKTTIDSQFKHQEACITITYYWYFNRFRNCIFK